MDLFKFNPGADPTLLVDGQAINKIKAVQWTERYRDPGEFEITANVSSGLREMLPVGTMISHIATYEVMIIESVNIKVGKDGEEDKVIIKGSSLEKWLKQRIVGDDIETYVAFGHRLLLTVPDYNMAFDTSWEQARVLIDGHINNVFNITNDNVVGFIPISNQQHIGTSTTEARTLRKQNVHSALLELLAIDDFGIQIVRPNSDNVDPTTTEFRIHNGVDRTVDVIFSHAFGDLEKPEYFWSDIALKTDYFCVSNYFALRSDSGVTGFNRRMLYVDCTDLDSGLSDDDVADGALTTLIGDAMDIRGQMMLRSQAATNILSTDVAKKTRYRFKRDYDVGDLVRVKGNFDVEETMRVVEHVSFQDENGESGYPTLAAVNE